MKNLSLFLFLLFAVPAFSFAQDVVKSKDQQAQQLYQNMTKVSKLLELTGAETAAIKQLIADYSAGKITATQYHEGIKAAIPAAKYDRLLLLVNEDRQKRSKAASAKTEITN